MTSNNSCLKQLQGRTTVYLTNSSMKLLSVQAISITITIYSHDCDTILNFIWERLKLEPEEWRKIFKSLHLLDIILKVGDPQCFSTIKGNIYKIKSFQSFTVKAGSEKGSGIREKAKVICDLLENPDMLEEERTKTRELRNKLGGVRSYGSIYTNKHRRKIWRY